MIQQVVLPLNVALLTYDWLDKIAECNEVIVAKIARQDYPVNW
jgi:hypothetical protein